MSVSRKRRARSRQCRLDEYESGDLPDPPLVILDRHSEAVYAPGESGTVAGHIGVIRHRDGRAYVARKQREKHHYRTGGGYAISKKILRYLMKNSVHHLIWYETNRNTTLEYGIGQYVEQGEPVRHAPTSDPQVFVPDQKARHYWHSHTPILDAR